jgi:hypothetical protein
MFSTILARVRPLILGWNQKYLLRVLLDKLPSCKRARKSLVGKTRQCFWKVFSIVKVADALLVNGAILDRDGNPCFVDPSAFVARCKNVVLS